MADITKSLSYVLGNEGSKYTNIPGDSGGPTKFGITWRALAAYRHRPVTAYDVMNLTLIEATKVYKQNFWDVCGLDQCRDQGVATAILDCAVNRGVGTARAYVKIICSQLGKSKLNDCDAAQFIEAFERRMEVGYRAIALSHPKDRKFLRGWIIRAKRLLTLAHKLFAKAG